MKMADIYSTAHIIILLVTVIIINDVTEITHDAMHITVIHWPFLQLITLYATVRVNSVLTNIIIQIYNYSTLN